MWHEARKQEKKIRGLMVDYKKRAERRREFYEKIVRNGTLKFTEIRLDLCRLFIFTEIRINFHAFVDVTFDFNWLKKSHFVFLLLILV